LEFHQLLGESCAETKRASSGLLADGEDFMFGRRNGSDAQAQLAAIGRSQAVIEFRTDGTILAANKNFLDVLGYALAEIQGKHHSMFVPADQRDGDGYRAFWAALNRGEY
jgi:methyl-accepting chemotaxis protein